LTWKLEKYLNIQKTIAEFLLKLDFKVANLKKSLKFQSQEVEMIASKDSAKKPVKLKG
jgi:hypothetical protein